MKKGKRTFTQWIDEKQSFEERTFYENTIVRFALLISFVLQCIALGILMLFVHSQQSIVIVHYNVYFGVDLIGVWAQIFIIPLIVAVFTIANTILAQWFYNEKERIASYLLLVTSVLVSLGSIVACASIAIINY